MSSDEVTLIPVSGMILVLCEVRWERSAKPPPPPPGKARTWVAIWPIFSLSRLFSSLREVTWGNVVMQLFLHLLDVKKSWAIWSYLQFKYFMSRGTSNTIVPVLYLLGEFSVVMSRAGQLTGQAHVLGWQGWESFLQWAAFLVFAVNLVVQLKVFLSELDAVLLWQDLRWKKSHYHHTILCTCITSSVTVLVNYSTSELGLYMKLYSVKHQ